jgi:hypothetical protein
MDTLMMVRIVRHVMRPVKIVQMEMLLINVLNVKHPIIEFWKTENVYAKMVNMKIVEPVMTVILHVKLVRQVVQQIAQNVTHSIIYI